jgi:hypothetical protein
MTKVGAEDRRSKSKKAINVPEKKEKIVDFK